MPCGKKIVSNGISQEREPQKHRKPGSDFQLGRQTEQACGAVSRACGTASRAYAAASRACWAVACLSSSRQISKFPIFSFFQKIVMQRSERRVQAPQSSGVRSTTMKSSCSNQEIPPQASCITSWRSKVSGLQRPLTTPISKDNV